MRKCPYCSADIKDDVAYCPHCDENVSKNVYERQVTTGGVWGGIIIFGVLFIVLFKVFSGGVSFYDKGYQDGAEEVDKGFLYSVSKSYKRGYDEGINLAWYFDIGCEDKSNRLAVRYPDVEKYMEGYHFCSGASY